MSNHNMKVSYSLPLFCKGAGSSSSNQRRSGDAELGTLFSYEKEELLAALRRDLREQLRKAKENPRDADCYLYRSRTLLRVLDVLNPKTANPRSQQLRLQGSRLDEEIKNQGGRVISTVEESACSDSSLHRNERRDYEYTI